LRVIPARGQVPEYAGESSASDSGDVFQEDELRSKNANGFGNVRPDSRARPFDTNPFPRIRNVLARKTGRDDVYALGFEGGPIDLSDIPEVRHPRESAFKDQGLIRVVVGYPYNATPR
jgi:hypothetical protein